MNRDGTMRFIMILLLVLVGMMAYRQFFPQQEPAGPQTPVRDPNQPAPSSTDAGQAPAQPQQPAVPAPATDLTIAPAETVAEPVQLGSAEYLGPYAMSMTLDSLGAGISSLRLSDYFATVDDRELPANEREKLPLINMIERDTGLGRTSLSLESITLGSGNQTPRVVVRGMGSARWNLVSHDENQAVYELHLNNGSGERAITIRRTWTLPRREPPADYENRFADPKSFGPQLRHDVQIHSGPYTDVTLQLRGPEGIIREDARSDARRVVAGWRATDQRPMEIRTGSQAQDAEDQNLPESLDWAGVINKYFSVVITRDEDIPTSRWGNSYAYVTQMDNSTPVPGVIIETEPMPLAGEDKTLSVEFTVMAGPRDDDLLSQPVWSHWGLEAVAELTTSCCLPIPGVKELAQLMIWAINGLAAIVSNYGVAIIILVIIVRLILLPVSRFSQVAMLRMKELQPEMAKLKERYKEDPHQLQLEQMKLFQEKGANPMVGCLPMLLQIPIWIALYTGIDMATSLRHAPFMLWIQDLSQPDALMSFSPVSVPIISFIGNWASWNLNILPLLMIVIMMLQMRMQADATASTPETQAQQKMMKWMMPGMLLLFLYSAPAALNLYILTSSLIGLGEQKYFRWHFEKIKNLPRKRSRKGIIAGWLEQKIEAARRLQEQGGGKPKLPPTDRSDKRRGKK